MAAPCGGTFGPNKNEYVELYNYGTADFDVSGLWITTNEVGEGVPDSIVSWDAKNPGINLGKNAITNTTSIPPKAFALVLSPLYYTGQGEYHMPYRFPEDTIVLTLGNSDYLGLDSRGLLGNSQPFSVLVLYQGTESVMDEIISTYGTPTYGSSPTSVLDEPSDGFPFSVADCNSVARIQPSLPDTKSSWLVIRNGNPGEGEYSE